MNLTLIAAGLMLVLLSLFAIGITILLRSVRRVYRYLNRRADRETNRAAADRTQR